MKCMHCDLEEHAFIELLVFDATGQVARGTLPQGVCSEHARYAGATIQMSDDDNREIVRLYGDEFMGVLERFRQMFPQITPPVSTGIRYHAYDGLVGQDMRMRRAGIANPHEARVHNPLMKLPVSRVTEEEFKEAFGIAQPAKGKIFG